jgi:tRNA pseudouridine38-40 synthase
MPRYKLTIEYDGTRFSGFQRQSNAYSVQQAIEEAIAQLCVEEVTVFAAGRTDAGVHATGQVIHFDLEKIFPAEIVQRALNYYLKNKSVAIIKAEEVDENFHARFSAIERFYQYVIINRPAPLVLEANRAWHLREALNIEQMQQAANYLLGTHDFTSFRAQECQAHSPIKTINQINITDQNDHIIFHLNARSFLHHMVRNILGTLRFVGNGKWPAEIIPEILEAKDRAKAGPTAPPYGLYLTKINY